jgi:pimeloyl-CoA synthetase
MLSIGNRIQIIKPYNLIGQLNLNMKREHFTKHGIHINGIDRDRISGLLKSRITELCTTHRRGTPISLPWEAETIQEEEKQMRPVVEECKFTSLELRITDEQGKRANSVKQDGVKVQNVDFDSLNKVEQSTLGKMGNRSDKLCKDSDNSTKALQITQDHKQTNNHKITTKIPKTRSDGFLWT